MTQRAAAHVMVSDVEVPQPFTKITYVCNHQ
jgi:hypothetical protein